MRTIHKYKFAIDQIDVCIHTAHLHIESALELRERALATGLEVSS